ncbi:DUF1822 family protein [Anabaena azotica]|uniref:DUF1822 family protein n=1 Tax=Anabaena azotica FACHB-119 TaxID=947527 RepID=A0ABR8DC65_9NOST|nr:DUF1822 family protein [Anabaena azotica]MBD2504088.1 DUF1822 family protein [Anabaena azotica FACHB-119]
MSDKLSVIRELAIQFPIPASFRQQARAYASQYFTPNAKERIYLSTLAVLVADAYFRLLGFETNLAKPERWNAVSRLWSEANELELTGLGYLECRVVPVEQHTVTLLPGRLSGGQGSPVSNNCLGYLFVEIASSEKEATLIGFLPAVHPETVDKEIAIDELQSMDDLIDYLAQQEAFSLSRIPQTDELTIEFAQKKITYLRNWLNNIYEGEWEPSMRDLRAATCKKRFLLAGQGFEMQLSVSQNDSQLIFVRVIIQGERASLPVGMQVSVPDESDIYTETVNEPADLISIPLELSPGEEFWVEVRIGDTFIREYFIA